MDLNKPLRSGIKIIEVVIENKFKINETDKCVHSKFNNKNGGMISLYVNDI